MASLPPRSTTFGDAARFLRHDVSLIPVAADACLVDAAVENRLAVRQQRRTAHVTCWRASITSAGVPPSAGDPLDPGEICEQQVAVRSPPQAERLGRPRNRHRCAAAHRNLLQRARRGGPVRDPFAVRRKQLDSTR